jgi:hypothetical protein
MRQVLQALARRGAVRLRQSHRYPVGQVDDHAIFVGRAVVPGTCQDQAAPGVSGLSDRLKRLALRPKIFAYHVEVLTVHWMKSHDQYDVAGRLGPSRQEAAGRLLRAERGAQASGSVL